MGFKHTFQLVFVDTMSWSLTKHAQRRLYVWMGDKTWLEKEGKGEISLELHCLRQTLESHNLAAVFGSCH